MQGLRNLTPLKRRSAGQKGDEDAAERPDIRCHTVRVASDNLWRDVVRSATHGQFLILRRILEPCGQTKVPNPDLPRICQQHVGELQVAMQDVVEMEERDCLDERQKDGSSVRLRQARRVIVLHILKQGGSRTELQNNVDVLLILERMLESDYRRMSVQAAMDLDLTRYPPATLFGI